MQKQGRGRQDTSRIEDVEDDDDDDDDEEEDEDEDNDEYEDEDESPWFLNIFLPEVCYLHRVWQPTVVCRSVIF